MNRQWFMAFLGAVTICGQLLGSTTLYGASVYAAVTVGWWYYMLSGREWGFLPLNIMGGIATAYNLYAVL